jgi:hypothetical protein
MEYRLEECTLAECILLYNTAQLHRANLANVIVEDIRSKLVLWVFFYREHCFVVKIIDSL